MWSSASRFPQQCQQTCVQHLKKFLTNSIPALLSYSVTVSSTFPVCVNFIAIKEYNSHSCYAVQVSKLALLDRECREDYAVRDPPSGLPA